MAYTELPKDENVLAKFMIGVDLFGKPDIDKRVDLYTSHSQSLSNILSKQLDKNSLFKSTNSKKILNQFLRKNGGIYRIMLSFQLREIIRKRLYL